MSVVSLDEQSKATVSSLSAGYRRSRRRGGPRPAGPGVYRPRDCPPAPHPAAPGTPPADNMRASEAYPAERLAPENSEISHPAGVSRWPTAFSGGAGPASRGPAPAGRARAGPAPADAGPASAGVAQGDAAQADAGPEGAVRLAVVRALPGMVLPRRPRRSLLSAARPGGLARFRLVRPGRAPPASTRLAPAPPGTGPPGTSPAGAGAAGSTPGAAFPADPPWPPGGADPGCPGHRGGAHADPARVHYRGTGRQSWPRAGCGPGQHAAAGGPTWPVTVVDRPGGRAHGRPPGGDPADHPVQRPEQPGCRSWRALVGAEGLS